MVSEKIWGSAIGAFVAYGKDGTTLVPVKVNADGELVVNLEAATVNIGDVDVLSSALPTGAATAANQTTQITKLDSIIAALAQLAALQDKVIGEVVNEVPNGTNDTFTVDYAFVANSEQVVVNRQVMTRGASYDYVPTGASKQIVFNAGAIPALAATIQVSYWKA